MNPDIDPGPSLPADVVSQAGATGVLESPLLWHALVVAAVVVGFTGVRHRARFVAVLLVAAALAWANASVGYLRTPADLLVALGVPAPRDSPQRLDRLDLPDPANGIPHGPIRVLLPPGYDNPANAHRRYPVVQLLPGSPGGTSDDWLTAGGVADTVRSLLDHGVIPPTVVVLPDVSAGAPTTDYECLDVPDGPRVETYLTRTVQPWVDRHYRTIPDRAHRALGGMSGGGFCALNTGLRHLDTYGTLLVSLPYDDLGDAAALLGDHPDLVRANTPRDYLPTMAFDRPVSVMLSAGADSRDDVVTARRVACGLRARGQRVAMRVERGHGHDWHAARAALPYLLAFAAAHTPREQEARPPDHPRWTRPVR
ncbi:alpha/beta hydrolase-fold protein [Actinosynnema sp. NPDC020468]|uniref:alpha/beta hydrolase n=1 Tax=Actinosynnema sp. NPDC020468 TaxID=3154488 RepID=UPI0033D5A4B6